MILNILFSVTLMASSFTLAIHTISHFETENLRYYKEWKKYGKDKIESLSDKKE